jgi:hypothetical protein
MKLTQKQLRTLVETAVNETLSETDTTESPDSLVRSLVRSLRMRATPLGRGEIYITTGEAEGVTVKVVRRGR